MARPIFLLAGKHKTGTTSVQNYLAANQTFLDRHGFTLVKDAAFPGPTHPKAPVANCILLAHMMIRSDLMTPMRLRARAPVETYAAQCANARGANAILHDLPGRQLIISAEAFSFLRTRREREVFDIAFDGFEIRPIVCFRNPGDWLKSWRKQTRNLRQAHGWKLARPGSVFDFSETSWLLDDAAIKRFFGPATRALSYEAAMDEHQSILPDVMNQLGFDPQACPPWNDVWDNRTRKKLRNR